MAAGATLSLYRPRYSAVGYRTSAATAQSTPASFSAHDAGTLDFRAHTPLPVAPRSVAPPCELCDNHVTALSLRLDRNNASRQPGYVRRLFKPTWWVLFVSLTMLQNRRAHHPPPQCERLMCSSRVMGKQVCQQQYVKTVTTAA